MNVVVIGEGVLGVVWGLSDYVYVIVGIGIGGGVVSDGCLLVGGCYFEVGYMWVGCVVYDVYFGCCFFYGDCFEGLVVGLVLWGCWYWFGEVLLVGYLVWEL